MEHFSHSTFVFHSVISSYNMCNKQKFIRIILHLEPAMSCDKMQISIYYTRNKPDDKTQSSNIYNRPCIAVYSVVVSLSRGQYLVLSHMYLSIVFTCIRITVNGF